MSHVQPVNEYHLLGYCLSKIKFVMLCLFIMLPWIPFCLVFLVKTTHCFKCLLNLLLLKLFCLLIRDVQDGCYNDYIYIYIYIYIFPYCYFVLVKIKLFKFLIQIILTLISISCDNIIFILITE